MSRVLALLGAVLLIAAAVVARTVLDDDDGSGGDDGGGDELVVSCIPELEAACQAIDRPKQLTIENPGETIARLAAGEDLDAWVTLDPWPDMATIIEPRATLEPVEPVASSDVVLVVRAGSLEGACADAPDWLCAVEQARGDVAVPSPSSAAGLLALGAGAFDWNARTTTAPSLSRAELELPEFRRWLDAIELTDDPLGDAFSFSPAGPQVIGTSGAEAAAIAGSREEGRLVPHTTGAVVALVVAGPRADRVAGEPSFTDALIEAGWVLDRAAATTGLPNAGVLVALRDAV